MSRSNFLEIQTSQDHDTVAGLWKLAPGRALSLQPRQNGVLRVAQGDVWVTTDMARHGAGNELGDYFLHAGECLAVSPGQHLVLEPMAPTGQTPVFFEWTPTHDFWPSHTPQSANAVTQSLRGLGLALGMVGTALADLSAGLVDYGRQLLRGRPVATQAQHCS